MITGPTGVGKTDFVLQLASKFPSEIINADIGQMYVPLTIGTAKPNWQSEQVPHHMFDIICEPKDFSIVQFRTQVTRLVTEIWARGKTPIIVGGSTLYIKSLFYKSAELIKLPDISQVLAPNNLDLWQSLNQIDPIRASSLHPNDHYRLKRALDIWQQTGILPSKCLPKISPICENMSLFIINNKKAELYSKIDLRVHVMMEMGWIAEVENLEQDWHEFLRRKKIIGYELILDYLMNKIDNKLKLINLIQQRVRNYAKRQQTFWQGLQKELASYPPLAKNIFEINLTLLDVNLYIEQLLIELKLN